MKISFLFSLALLLAATVPGASAAVQLANDPPSYFGGVNHQSYLEWIGDNNIAEKYNSSVFIPSREGSLGAAVHWTVDDEYFYVAVAARATGWVGFGLSEGGGKQAIVYVSFCYYMPRATSPLLRDCTVGCLEIT